MFAFALHICCKNPRKTIQRDPGSGARRAAAAVSDGVGEEPRLICRRDDAKVVAKRVVDRSGRGDALIARRWACWQSPGDWQDVGNAHAHSSDNLGTRKTQGEWETQGAETMIENSWCGSRIKNNFAFDANQ